MQNPVKLVAGQASGLAQSKSGVLVNVAKWFVTGLSVVLATWGLSMLISKVSLFSRFSQLSRGLFAALMVGLAIGLLFLKKSVTNFVAAGLGVAGMLQGLQMFVEPLLNKAAQAAGV